MKKEISTKKTQFFCAICMLVLSGIPIGLSRSYETPPAIEVVAETLPIVEEKAEAPVSIAETTAPAEPYMPTPGELNLAYYFPEGADTGKRTESLAGKAFTALMTQDEAWMSGIHDLSDSTPLQLAVSLGKAKSQVLGKYNYKDEKHDPKNPDTWTVNSFKKIRMTFTDGDGKAVSAYSNVIDIMAMANLYTYFYGVEDYDLFISYAKSLWDKSHSYSVGISSLYYCKGCLDEDGERRELEELEAEALAEDGALEEGTAVQTGTNLSAGGSTNETAGSEAATPVESSAKSEVTNVIEAGTTKVVEETAQEQTMETIPESTSGVIVSGNGGRVVAPQENPTSGSVETTAGNSVNTEEISVATAANATSSQAVTVPSAAPSETLGEKSSEKELENSPCPGHIDLIVNAKVIGIKEERGLFEKDVIGNDSANIKEGGWPGWNNYTKASARLLSSQDWFDKYGLSLSLISTRNPLTESEIDAYMAKLPEGTSQTRKDIISFALSSVGKVPYYWGGKPSAPNYSGNSFGMYTTPDEKGRVLKGLDCSGWISWVYWSVTGNRLAYEGTSGLAISGTRIKRSELQPGDIIVRTGSDAHVIMFLGWTSDGKIQCIHESSAGVNNVTVSVRDANWSYYRRLVD